MNISKLVYIIRFYKPYQLFYRVLKRLHIPIRLSVFHRPSTSKVPLATCQVLLPDIDYDSLFIRRFSVPDMKRNRLTLLNHSSDIDMQKSWNDSSMPRLWLFNLHYFEYLYPLMKEYAETGDVDYAKEAQRWIDGWIRNNPIGKGPGWDAYTLAIRLVSWISCYIVMVDYFASSEEFHSRLYASLMDQYFYLSSHLEKDLYANHYLKELHALCISAIFFQDNKSLFRGFNLFVKQIQEQVLPDGMHFERSFMYHRIVLEDILRVACCMKSAGIDEAPLHNSIQHMLTCMESIEGNISRMPLFNDSGNNVAKSKTGLAKVAYDYFGIRPEHTTQFPVSGYFTLKNGPLYCIIDCGLVGPSYAAGHAHCDTLSFELFWEGRPIFVNCGTYMYQSPLRPYFRSTGAHNTFAANGNEQTQCWDVFRTAKRAVPLSSHLDSHTHLFTGTIKDAAGATLERTIQFTSEKTITICDCLPKNSHGLINSFLHLEPSYQLTTVTPTEFHVQKNDVPIATITASLVEKAVLIPRESEKYPYAPSFGELTFSDGIEFTALGTVRYEIDFTLFQHNI